jgi:hypothetical protein
MMRTSYRRSLTAGVAVVAVLVAAPAIGGVADSDPSGQPPPGAEGGVATDHFAPSPEQPGAGAPAQKVTEVAPVPAQPANPNPKQSTGFQAGAELRHSKSDEGVKGLKATRDRGRQNLPVQPETGHR